MTSLSRFIFNTTLGVAGLVDVSGKMGLSQHRSDLGQTFGVWGIANGPIVELPLLGTHNVRDATGKVLSMAVDPFGDNSDTVATLTTVAMARLLPGNARLHRPAAQQPGGRRQGRQTWNVASPLPGGNRP